MEMAFRQGYAAKYASSRHPWWNFIVSVAAEQLKYDRREICDAARMRSSLSGGMRTRHFLFHRVGTVTQIERCHQIEPFKLTVLWMTFFRPQHEVLYYFSHGRYQST